jgi:hypothetical protein
VKPWQIAIIAACVIVGVFTAIKAYIRMDALLAINAGLLLVNGIVWSSRWGSAARKD